MTDEAFPCRYPDWIEKRMRRHSALAREAEQVLNDYRAPRKSRQRTIINSALDPEINPPQIEERP